MCYVYVQCNFSKNHMQLEFAGRAEKCKSCFYKCVYRDRVENPSILNDIMTDFRRPELFAKASKFKTL